MNSVNIVRVRVSCYRNFTAVKQIRCYTKVTSNVLSPNDGSSQTKTSSTAENPVKPEKFFDIVVCGGGLVGTAMASALGKNELFKNHKIALIESAQERKPYQMPEYHSNRVSALNKASIDLLKSLDCFDFIEKSRYWPVKQMQVWEAVTDSLISFQADDQNDLAMVIENDLVQASLDQRIKDFKNVEILNNAQVKDISKPGTRDEDTIQVKLKDDTVINTKLLIGSDGPNSFVRKQAGFNVTQFEYDQIAIVATLRLEPGLNLTAWQRFLPTGPLALLPLNNEYSSLVWSIEKQFAKELMTISDEDFVARLNSAFVDESHKSNFATNVDKVLDDGITLLSSFIQKENLISPKIRQLPPRIEALVPKTRGSYPLGFCHSNNYVKSRIALVGDSAHRIHPLAGQGVNLGFGDVVCLNNKLSDNIKSGMDLGSALYLENYEKERQKDVYPKIMFIHFLNSLYTTRTSPLQTPYALVRSLGLTLTNRLNFLKNFYMEGAMK